MRNNIKFGISALLVAMLLISMVFVPAVSAKTINNEIVSEIELTEAFPELEAAPDVMSNSISVNEKMPYWYLLEADKDQQKTLFKYIDNCYVSNKEKTEMKKSMKDIWNRNPDKITEEDLIVLEKIDRATAEYLNDKHGVNDEVSIKWTATPHKEIINISVKKWSITDYYAQIARDAAPVPDTLPLSQIWQSYNHYYDPVEDHGLAAINCDSNAIIAAIYYDNSLLSAAYTQLGYSSHFLSDVGNPFHTGLVANQTLHQWVHYDYESYVYSNWKNGYNFESVIKNNNNYYTITDPEQAAKDLAEYSNSYVDSMWMYIYYNENTWESNSNVKSITENVLLKTAKYNLGLVKFMRS